MKTAIIGAGPRGVLTISALINQYKNRTDKEQTLTIELFDSYQIGGRVWKLDQWPGLIMNTPADQVTLFTDASVTLSSPVFDGPSLFEWATSDLATNYLTENKLASELITAAQNLGPKDYAPRALFGAYIQWFYAQLLSQLPFNVHINFHQELVVRLDRLKNSSITLTTSEQEYMVDSVTISLGQQENYLTEAEQTLALYANEHNLSYTPPTSPADVDLSKIPANENVIVRGIGLSFFDYVSELTLGRGGHYMQNSDGTLVYQPSGREPRIIAGSKRSIPYYPKAISQKGYGEKVRPSFLTEANIQSALVDGHLPYDEFIKLLRLDIELAYYMALIDTHYPTQNASQFKAAFIQNENRQAVVADFGILSGDVWNWDRIIHPVGNQGSVSTVEYQNELISWIDWITNDAELGSKTGPITSALELLRDFRDVIRSIINRRLFTDDEYVNRFLSNYNSTNNFLSVGPPALRTAQLSALMRSGIVTITAPDMEIEGRDGRFVAITPRNNDVFAADIVLEARVPKPSILTTSNPLLEDMVSNNLLSPTTIIHEGKIMPLPAVSVTQNSDQVVAATGQVLPNVFVWGLQLESLRWSTTLSPRPGVNDLNLQTADFIAAKLLHLIPADDAELM